MTNLLLLPEPWQSFLPAKKLKNKALAWLGTRGKDNKNQICCLTAAEDPDLNPEVSLNPRV